MTDDGRIIATRTLYTKVGDTIEEITIQFELPIESRPDEWVCECLIVSRALSVNVSRHGIGVDGVQAFMVALQSVGALFEELDLTLAISRQPLMAATPDERWLGDHFPRRIDVKHGLSNLLAP